MNFLFEEILFHLQEKGLHLFTNWNGKARKKYMTSYYVSVSLFLLLSLWTIISPICKCRLWQILVTSPTHAKVFGKDYAMLLFWEMWIYLHILPVMPVHYYLRSFMFIILLRCCFSPEHYQFEQTRQNISIKAFLCAP